MELIEKLNQMKSILVSKNLDQLVDTVNETIEYLKAVPTAVAPTVDDFFPLQEAKSEQPIVFHDCSVYIGDDIALKLLEKFNSVWDKNENEKQSPPGEE